MCSETVYSETVYSKTVCSIIYTVYMTPGVVFFNSLLANSVHQCVRYTKFTVSTINSSQELFKNFQVHRGNCVLYTAHSIQELHTAYKNCTIFFKYTELTVYYTQLPRTVH